MNNKPVITLFQISVTLGFLLVFISSMNITVNSVWSEPSVKSDDQIKEPKIEDVESWGAFRGWSQPVPYGQNSFDQMNKINLSNKPEAEDKNQKLMDEINTSTSRVNKKPSNDTDE